MLKFRADLSKPLLSPNPVFYYKVPLSNNVMPIKQNKYENACTKIEPCGQNPGIYNLIKLYHTDIDCV